MVTEPGFLYDCIHNSNIYYPATLGQKVNEHTSHIKNEDFLFKLTKKGLWPRSV